MTSDAPRLDPPSSTTVPPSASARPLRLWPAVLLVALFWGAFAVVARFEKPYFVGFIYSMAAPALLVILYSTWWWTRRGFPWADRIVGCALVVGLGIAIAPLCHRSVLFALPTVGLPLAITALTLWLLLLRATGFAWGRLGLAVVLLLAWSCFALLRNDGVDGDLQAKMSWRWTPTPEEQFLAERAKQVPAAAAPPSAQALALAPGDWPAFRGPNRDGVIPGVKIATDWNASPPQERWRRRVGPAWSAVIVIGDRLFTQEQRGEEEAVVCYQAETGEELWSHADKARFWEAVSGAGPRATPTFADGRLFTLGATGILNCLDAATGGRHWSHNVAEDAGAQPPMWGYASSPLVVDDKVIVFAGGPGERNLLAYEIGAGKLAWAAAASHDSYASPQLVELGGKRQCLLLGDQGMSAVDPISGEALWRYGWVMDGAPRSAQAHVLGATQLVAGTLGGTGVGCVDLSQQAGKWQASEVWNSSAMKPEFPDLVTYQGHAYGFDGAIFCCLDLKSGERRWKKGRYGHGQVVLLEEQGVLLVISEQGEALLVAADPEQHRELGKFAALRGKTWNSPVVAHGRLYLRNAEELACYDLPGFAPLSIQPLP